jgi:23S rRNA (pseudouridine1915-N3)-methyltransferase
VRFTVVAEGRLKERGLREVGDDYLKRIRRHARCEEVEVRDSSAIERAIPDGALRVALEVRGRTFTSPEFAAKLEAWSANSKGGLCFLIGGAEGLPKQLSARCEETLSLSTMTLPHRLARLILLEQIYRGLSILRGEPYAREG